MARGCWGYLKDMRADAEIGTSIWRRCLRREIVVTKTGTEKPVIPRGATGF